VRQPLYERCLLEAVVAVMGVAVNRLGTQVLHGYRREGHDMQLSVADDRRGRHVVNRNQVVMIDGSVSCDGLQTEHLPETVRDVYRGFAHGVAGAATRFDGRRNLNAIQAILAANRRRGIVVEEVPGRPDLISGGDYGKTEGYRIHGSCFEAL
jgi:hypothetical protein